MNAELRQDGWWREIVTWLLPVYVLLITAGYFLFRSDMAMVKGNALSGDRALFTSVNVVTLTGLQISVGPDQFLPGGQLAVLVLTLLSAVMTTVIGGLAVTRIAKMGISDGRVVVWACVMALGTPLVGMLLLTDAERPALHAAFLGLSAYANSGLHFGPLTPAGSLSTQLLLLPLSLLGGLGVPVMLDCLDRLMGKRETLSAYSRVVLALTAGGYLVSTLVLWAFSSNLVAASTLAVDARAAGLGYELAYTLPRVTQWFLMAVMLVGASPGGTGGGLKNTTVAQLVIGVIRALRNQPVGRAFGIAATWTGMYITTVGIILLGLLAVNPQVPADRMLFDLLSAVGNVGLSFDVIAIVGPGLYLLAAGMFFGRFAPLLVLWWMADTTDGPNLPVG